MSGYVSIVVGSNNRSYIYAISDIISKIKSEHAYYEVVDDILSEISDVLMPNLIFTKTNEVVPDEILMENFRVSNENMTFVDSLFIYGQYFIDTDENRDECSDNNAYVFKPFQLLLFETRVNSVNYYIINSHTCKYAVFRGRYTTALTRTFTIEYKIKV